MTVVVLGMLVCLAAAVAVLALVAIPRVREGQRVLTPDGEAAIRDARRRARALARDPRLRARVGGEASPAAGPPAPEPAAAPNAPAAGAPRLEPAGPKAQEERRLASTRERIARSLEWGDPELGPRHRR